jgi:NADPH-dependent 2,4-dienoyl-CoA reductase/sulfur reductase-like enzyme
LAPIAADLSVKLAHATLAAVYPDRKRIRTVSGTEIDYDAVVVAVGARRRPCVAGAQVFRGASDAGHGRPPRVLNQSRSGTIWRHD